MAATSARITGGRSTRPCLRRRLPGLPKCSARLDGCGDYEGCAHPRAQPRGNGKHAQKKRTSQTESTSLMGQHRAVETARKLGGAGVQKDARGRIGGQVDPGAEISRSLDDEVQSRNTGTVNRELSARQSVGTETKRLRPQLEESRRIGHGIVEER